MKKKRSMKQTQRELCSMRQHSHHIYFKQMWRTALLTLMSALKKSCSSPFHYTRTTWYIFNDMEIKASYPNPRSHHSRYYTGSCDFTWPFHLSSDKLAHDGTCLRRKNLSKQRVLWRIIF